MLESPLLAPLAVPAPMTPSLTAPTAPPPEAPPMVPMQGVVGQVVGWLEHLIATIGAPGAGLAVALENIFPPIPSEVILPLAGFAVAQGHFSLASAIVWTTLGSTIGALALYWLGRALGVERLAWFADRLPLTDRRDVDRAMAWFERWGTASVFLGRMVPGVRSLISIPAGVGRMGLLHFTAWSALGSLVWNSLLVYAGYALGANWGRAEGWVAQLQDVVVLVLAAAALVFVVRRVRSRRQERREQAVGGAGQAGA